jgi:WD40 repeat protein
MATPKIRFVLAVAVLFGTSMGAFAQAKNNKDVPPPSAGPLVVKATKDVKIGTDLLCVASVPGTAKVYAGGSNGKIFAIDFDGVKGEPEAWNGHVSYVSGLALAGKFLVSGGSDHKLIWWNASTKEKIREIVAHDKKWIRGVAASPDGKLVASVGDDMVCRLWDASSGKLLHDLVAHEKLIPQTLASKLYCCRFSADGKYLASGDQTGTAIVWEVASGKQVGKVRAQHLYQFDGNGHSYGGCRALAFSPDGTRLALVGNIAGDTSTIGGSKALVQIFDWKAGKMTHDLPVNINGFFESAMFHPKESWLFAGCGAGGGKKVVLFDLDKKAIVQEFPAGRPILDIALNESADSLVAVGRSEARRWQLSK